MKKYDDKVIPTFLPDHLPRPDYGDREYYCCTMLTIFKPWRSGKDLKHKYELWHNAFTSFDFSEVQKEKMEFLNIRYQCLDARDDFSAKCKNNNINIHFQWETSEMLDSLNNTHETDALLNGGDFNVNDNDATEPMYFSF
jgi:hypothetical protein